MMKSTFQDEVCSPSEAAALLKVSRPTITRLVQSGHLRPVHRSGEHVNSPMLFLKRDVEQLEKIRTGEAGDVLDRVDLAAAGADETEDRAARRRAAWLAAIETVTDLTGGTFHTGQLRPFLKPEDAGPEAGALISGLVRSKVIEWTGEYDSLGDSRARHSSSPCKVYRVIGVLA